MPESNISVTEFLKEVWDDYNSPITSSFVSKIGDCKSTIAQYEESIDSDRRNLNKLKKSLKALRSSGSLHVTNESLLAESLLRLSFPEKDLEESISQAFYKFSVVTKELSTLLTHLMQKLNNGLMFPLDNFLKNDLGGIKGDLKKPFDKSWKDYEIKFTKIEKEKKQVAKEAGMIKTEVTGPEVAEEMEKERRIFQLQACEYLIKVNEIRTKKGADLLHHLMDFYQAQNNYFQDGLKTIEHYRCYIEELSNELTKLRQKQDLEKRGLVELRETLRQSVASFNKELTSLSQPPGYQLHQLQGNKIFGCEKVGWLLKKSDGKMRKVWQKRKCVVRDGFLFISHSDASKDPVKLNLLTCQVKMVADDPGRKCFDLISSSENRTYHFQCDDSQDLEAWTSVLNNAKNSILMKAFQSEPSSPGNRSSCTANNVILQSGLQKFQELSKAILKKVKKLRGNDRCCDCNSPDPEWLSVNLGVLICLECCGVHRDLGVHISRTQSIVIDDIVTSQLILAEVMTNQGFNDIMEATLESRDKLQPKSTMEERKHFIRQKYEKRKYAIVTCANNEDRRQDLKQAVLAGDLYALLQVYAEGIDFMQPLPDMANGENALHLAILQENGHNLHIVDFIIQNTNSRELGRQTFEENTALHLCSLEDKSECMKLLLRANPELVGQVNAQGLTALAIANERNSRICPILLQHAMENKSLFFEYVTTDWAFIQQIMEDQYHDNLEFSDDDLDWSSDIKKSRSRPGSLVLPNDLGMPALSQRSLTTENLNPLPQATPRSKNASSNNFSMISSTSSVSQDQSGISLSNQMFRKKAPPPPPPTSRIKSHLRNPSDPVIVSHQLGAKARPKDMMPMSSDLSSEFNYLRPIHTKSQNIQILRPGSDEKGIPPALPPKPNNRLRSQILDLMIDGPPSTALLHSPAPLTSKQESMPDKKNEIFFKKCKALFDCEADNDDELSFKKGEKIIILRMEEDDWWEGQIEGDPKRRGLFPSTFVTEDLSTPPLKVEDIDTF